MGNSGQSDEGFDFKEVIGWIGRRELFVGAVASILGGLILTGQSNSDDHLTRVEDRLVELAASIDDADLVNPRQSSRFHKEVTNAIESVNDALNQQSPDDPQTKQRISALTAAIDYYTVLAKTFDAATKLLSRVADSEFSVLNHEGDLGYNLEAKLDAGEFKGSIVRLSEAEKEVATVTSRNRKLVPNQQQLVDSLREQYNVYDLHITAQQTFLDTAKTIESGIRAHEQSHFDVAQSKLTRARKRLADGIPTTNYRYRLSHAGLTLNQYATLLTLRRKGVEKLLNVSDPSVTLEQRRSVSDEAITLFFEARGVVTN